MARWTDLPPDIATILRTMQKKAATGESPRFFSIFYLPDGSVQVNVQNPKDRTAWSVTNNPDVCIALAEALGPKLGGSWREHLKTAPVPAPEEEDDDDFDVV